MDFGVPICQVLGDTLVHTSRYTTFLEFKSEPIFPDPVICLLHVYPHCQCMLLILEAILDLLGNVRHLVLSGMVLPKACLLWSDEAVLLQVPYQASVDHSFHEFAHTTGEADRTVAVSICSVLALLVDGYHVSFSPAPRNMPCLQLLLKIPRSLDFAMVPMCSSISLVILSGPGDFLSFQVFRASSNSFVLNGQFMYSGGS